MIHTLKLTRNELEMLLGVLESKQRSLAVEISNTDALRAKASLRRCSRGIDRLIARIQDQQISDLQKR